MKVTLPTIARSALWVAPFFVLMAVGASANASDEDALWLGGLKAAYFGDRPVRESDDVIELDAPIRAENPALVPISITAKIPQTEERFIKTIHLVVDKNPGALAGIFRFTPDSGRADLDMRIRVNAYTPVRAIAETSDGQLHMSRRFVKASGGCSAPVGTDADAAMARLGKMKIKTPAGVSPGEPTLVQLMVSHPNFNGMQMDQLTRLYRPAHFVKAVKVSFEGKEIFSAETTFAVSENPNFRFYFVPEREGELEAEVVDTNELRFTHAATVSLTDSSQGLARKQ